MTSGETGGLAVTARTMLRWFSMTDGLVLGQEGRRQGGRDQPAALLLGGGPLQEDARLTGDQPLVPGLRQEIGLVVLLLGPENEAAIRRDGLGPDERQAAPAGALVAAAA